LAEASDAAFEVARVPPARLHELRRRILRSNDPEVSVVDPRDDDDTARHYAGVMGGRVVVCASFYPSPSPVDPGVRAYQLRYMATDADVQGRGFGARVLETAFAELRALGAEQVWANGRDSALGFYRRTGWRVVEGSEHVSAATGLPHTVIYRMLD
jgi:GNAT superfamily N-acetyltransferase